MKSLPFDEQKLRSRQNVILELGFFLGKLGSSRVCALYQEDVEIPSDYDGVLFVPLDGGGAWHIALARELKAAGLDIDSTLLPDYHKDPFDRLLVAQANQNSLLIVTKDRNIDKYEVETFWM